MKLYFPTSTLNLNNILSSDSLSPAAFYARRGFGFRRWTSVPESGLQNALVLYDRPFRFARPASDVEDHPLWVEVETDEEFPPSGDVRLADHTLYLSPWRARFLFFSEADCRAAQSLARQSSEVKLSRLYVKGLEVRPPELSAGGLPAGLQDVPLNEAALKQDRRVNRMKGLLYGYYLGALLSESQAVANQRRDVRGLRDRFSALWSAFSTVGQPAGEKACGQWQAGATLPEQLIGWLAEVEAQLDRRAAAERYMPRAADEEIVVADGRLARLAASALPDAQDRELFLRWANEVLTADGVDGAPDGYDLATRMTEAGKALLGPAWEGSALCGQLNAMRRLVSGEVCDFSWTDPLCNAAAAALLWSDDWERMRRGLREQGTTDFRLAFALYGELKGFANLTRDLTDHFFALPDRGYVAEVYKEIYGQLHGTDADVKPQKAELPAAPQESPAEQLARHAWHPDEAVRSGGLEELVWTAFEKLPRLLTKKQIADGEPGVRAALEMAGSGATADRFLDFLRKEKGCSKRSSVYNKEMEKMLLPQGQNADLPFSDLANKVQTPPMEFTYENREAIVADLAAQFGLSEQSQNFMKDDLRYSLDPKYAGQKSQAQLLEDFRKKLEKEKEDPHYKEEKGKEAKRKAYAKLNIPAIIDYLRGKYKL